ncbi:MAG TPA: cyclase family protein [Gemmataceae bacterium]|nr:cyclase family protein [Gemmataceae bacterium]
MIYDISPALSERLKVWPGDTPPKRRILFDMTRGDNITLSSLDATVHLGAHADAPSHYGLGAPAIHERSLDYYLGPCQVIKVSVPRGVCITPKLLSMQIGAERVLLATNTYPDPERFNEDFASLTPELVEMLHSRGVKLIGIDTPSVDPFSSKELPAHRMFLKCDMAILEGIVLKNVPPGMYELIALPLKLVDFDASPVRAILRTLPERSA